MKTIKGFIVENNDNEYLTEKLFWYPHESMDEAYVHEELSIKVFRKWCRNWEVKPRFLIPAIHENGKVTIIGKKQAF